jgi:lactoylglutathione lyase
MESVTDAHTRLNLVVIRCADLERSAAFYSCLGLQFVRHQHGGGPQHLSADVGGVVLELYPAKQSGSPVNTRLGFQVRSVDEMVAEILKDQSGGGLVSAPADSQWGKRAVVADPDGYRIELTE